VVGITEIIIEDEQVLRALRQLLQAAVNLRPALRGIGEVIS
jgi:hypothetical protein